jgi:hydrogenase large subunit
MTRVVVDPVTRIEGHLRIEAQVEDGVVKDAWSSSTMFRGIEIILKGRDPRDAWAFAQRICGVCTTVHAITSIRAVENAIGSVPPPNAELVRNLVMSAQLVQDHVIHFYHLHALDWVDVVSALSADPAKTSALAESISDWPKTSPKYFAAVRDRVDGLAKSGRLGPFANAYWGHPAYHLPPEANLMAVAHYLEALDWQREFIKIHAILGGKNPHPQSFLVGGMAVPIDPNEQASLNVDSIEQIRALIRGARQFVSQVYIPDVLAVAPFYPEWTKVGGTAGNYLVYGEYREKPQPDSPDVLPGGVIRGGDLSRVEDVDTGKITEYVTHSWYTYTVGDDKSLPPSKGETNPSYTGPAPPYEHLEVESKYSWLKAPRYDGVPMEVGPLARMLVSYGRGQPQVKALVDHVLGVLGAGPAALHSTLGRIAARAIESEVIVDKMDTWASALLANMEAGDLRICDNAKWDPSTWPEECAGAGFHEAPRGSLGHWVHIQKGRIANYQCIVPSTWNAGPRDAGQHPGPYEQSLVGTPIADPEQPLEILRTIHSFDPCMACGVHVIDGRGRSRAEVRVR